MKYYKMLATLTTAADLEPFTYWFYAMVDDFFEIPVGAIQVTEEEWEAHCGENT